MAEQRVGSTKRAQCLCRDSAGSAIAPHPVIGQYYGSPAERGPFVGSLFDRCARDYERIDAVTSLGTGSWYRRKALLAAGLTPGMRVLDVGCGTGLVALPAAEIVGQQGYVLGIDPSEAMRVVAEAHAKFDVLAGAAGSLPVAGERFDMVTMGYALRHVDDLGAAFAEFLRALVPGGTALVMEITPPRSVLGRMAIKFVMRWVVPSVSAIVSLSVDGWRLMRYFWETIDKCVPPESVLDAMERAGFENVRRSVELGVFSVYSGRRPQVPSPHTDEGAQ